MRGVSRRGEYGLALLAGALGGGLILLAVRQRWAQAVFTPPKPLSPEVIGVSGTDLVPLAGALGIAALACLAAVIATRGLVRRIVGALLAAFGAGAAVAVAATVSAGTVLSVAASKVGSPGSAAVSGAAGSTTGGSVASGGNGISMVGATGQAIMSGTPWRAAVFAGALLVVVAGIATAWRGPRWPVMSARYDLPERHPGRSATSATPGADAAAADPVPARDSASIWESLSAGTDPTDSPLPALRQQPMPASRVLVADHEPEVSEMCRRYLSRAGLDVQVVSSPAEALEALAGRAADLFVLDLTMPGLEVPAIRRSLFGEGSGQAAECPPAVFLLDRLGIRPRGLIDGSAFPRRWLARPFSPRTLSDAVTELLAPASMGPAALGPAGEAPRQAFPEPAAALPAGLQLDGDRRQVTVAGQVVPLTRTEFALVAALARQPGRALSRQHLLAVLERERGKRPTARAVDVYITQLRAKLGADLIKTVHGIGYRLGEP